MKKKIQKTKNDDFERQITRNNSSKMNSSIVK